MELFCESLLMLVPEFLLGFPPGASWLTSQVLHVWAALSLGQVCWNIYYVIVGALSNLMSSVLLGPLELSELSTVSSL